MYGTSEYRANSVRETLERGPGVLYFLLLRCLTTTGRDYL